MTLLNETHDPAARSWVESANEPDTDFPIQNLPFGVFRRAGSGETFRGGVAIGTQILDMAALQEMHQLQGMAAQALAAAVSESLNALMALGPAHWSQLRRAIWELLHERQADSKLLERALVAQADASFALPAVIGDFTDFYASIHHATTVGGLYRPENPLMPNYKWVPVAYHGRSSSIAVSGQRFARPVGQRMPPDAAEPVVGPSVQLDYELELGLFVGPGNALGQPIPVAQAQEHVFGFSVLNDWSARDIQRWEYQPLGPFLGKNFATTISPWVVTLEALAPFRTAWTRPAADPPPLEHLALGEHADVAALDVMLSVSLQSERMREENLPPQLVAQSNYRHAYWSFAQMLAHHTSNGCNLRPGDFIGTGTLSGPGAAELGSFLEVTRGGRQPFMLPTGEARNFIADGDAVVMRAWCAREGAARIGFGECTGIVLPAVTPEHNAGGTR
jgi:fumarylacetoacetase